MGLVRSVAVRMAGVLDPLCRVLLYRGPWEEVRSTGQPCLLNDSPHHASALLFQLPMMM